MVPLTRSGHAAGALERKVLAFLAAAARPLTAGEVLADLGGTLAYTTVLTNRASVLASFVAHLDEDDEQLLAGLIDERTHPANGQAGIRSARYALGAVTV